MNTYEISFQRSNGTTVTDRVVAATPGEAKKLFKEIYRHSEEFQNKDLKVELVAEGVPSTKDQEREALEKIKAIVEALGPDSYIGTALEGCFEIAEENIENDFACSMKQRVEAVVVENTRLKEKIKRLEDELAECEKDYEAARAAAHEVAEEKDAEIAYLKGKVDSLAAKVPSADDLTDCIQMARDSAYGYREKMEEAAASVVELADDPSSPEFTKAVKDHRNAKTAYEYAEALASRLEKIRDNTPAGEQ